MAERRMFTQKITESDAFLDMPLSTQALYFHLCMNADDDGFVKNPKRIARMMGASDDDMRLLVAKSFVIVYESGVIVIKHWRMHNLLRKDRYKETEYVDEKSSLYIKGNGAYTLDEKQGEPLMATKWQPNGNQMAPQDSIGKDSIVKDSIDKDIIKEKDITNVIFKKKSSTRFIPPTLEDVSEYCTERDNGVDPQKFIDFYESKGWMVGKNKMKDWKAAVRTWEHGNDSKKRPWQSNNDQFDKLMEQIRRDENGKNI